jgi:Fic family protein
MVRSFEALPDSMNAEIPEPLRTAVDRLDAKKALYARTPRRAIESLNARLRVELTYSSNAIEGNTLSLRETQLVVEEGLAPGHGKTLREIYEARNHFAAIQQVERNVAEGLDISARALLDLHQIVMRDIDADWGGRLRNGPVFIKGSRHTPPNAALVSEQLDALIHRAKQPIPHPVLVAADTHFAFETLHPFFDGNGRTGRLLLNWQLLASGFPITVIQIEERARYLEALDRGHSGDLLPLRMLVIEAVERSLDLGIG